MSTLELVYDERLATVKKKRDWLLWMIVGVTLTLSIAAFIYFSHKGVLFGHRDSISHLMIARRAVAGDRPHLLLLGSVWLPLEHVLMLPFVWWTPLYYSGVAGAIVGGASYIVTSVCIYKIVTGLTQSRIAALAGVAVFALNPNMLYLQTTAMMEPVFFATTAVAIYFMQKWIQTDRHGYIVASAIAVILSCMTRYEAWFMFGIYAAIAAFIAARKGIVRNYWVAFTFFVISLLGGIGAWLAYNQLFFNDWLYFRTGEYGDPKLWESLQDPSIGSWSNALQTYWHAVRDDLNLVIVLLAIAGIACLLGRRKLDALPVLALVLLFPFFVYSIEGAQSPLRVMQVAGSMFNLRYGLVMLLPAAVAIGYLVGLLSRVALLQCAVAGGIVIATVLPFIPSGVDGLVTYQEAKAGMEASRLSDQYDASQFLRREYDGGLLLAESSNNETVLFDGRIPLENNIYEGTYKKWDPALERPAANNISWIVMRRTVDTTVERVAADKVFDALNSSPELGNYELVFEDTSYFIYHKKVK